MKVGTLRIEYTTFIYGLRCNTRSTPASYRPFDRNQSRRRWPSLFVLIFLPTGQSIFRCSSALLRPSILEIIINTIYTRAPFVLKDFYIFPFSPCGRLWTSSSRFTWLSTGNHGIIFISYDTLVGTCMFSFTIIIIIVIGP